MQSALGAVFAIGFLKLTCLWLGLEHEIDRLSVVIYGESDDESSIQRNLSSLGLSLGSISRVVAQIIR